MGSDKIFMFDNPAAGESAGIMSMIPALLQNKGLDPNLVAALMNGNKNQDAWGGAGCYWIWIILLFFLWGGNGFGNGFGNGANGIPAQLNNEAGRELLMNAIQGNGTAINQLASSLNCSTQQLQNAICQIQGQIQQVGNQVGLSSQQIINSIQSNSAAIGSVYAKRAFSETPPCKESYGKIGIGRMIRLQFTFSLYRFNKGIIYMIIGHLCSP